MQNTVSRRDAVVGFLALTFVLAGGVTVSLGAPEIEVDTQESVVTVPIGTVVTQTLTPPMRPGL